MGASEIKAGGAFIEILGKSEPFDKALAAAGKKLQDFGAGMTSIGTKFSALGATLAAPLLMSAKAFADYGENIGKLASKTGMSAESLAGLSYAAQSSGIAVGTVASGIKTMQRQITADSKQSAEAFGKLGLSAASLKGQNPEEQFFKLADAIAGVSDPAEKAVIAQQLLGRAGVELLPILENGSSELRRMQREARMLGLVLGPEATENAKKMDEAFDRLAGSLKGLALHIGQNLYPLLKPIIDRFTDIVIAARQWIDMNPAFIESWAKIAIGLTGVGAAMVALGAGITALLSPTFLITAGLIAILMGIAAVTDAVGQTKTGFGDLFNAIRIDGTGLGTWMGVWSAKLGDMIFNNFFGVVLDGLRGFVTLFINGASLIFQAWIWMPKKIVEAFNWLGQSIADQLNRMLGNVNGILRGLGMTEIQVKFSDGGVGKFLENAGNAAEGFRQKWTEEYFNNAKGRGKERSQFSRLAEQDIQKAFVKDPQDATGGVGFDWERAKKAVGNIGENAWNAVRGMIDEMLGKLNIPRTNFESPGQTKPGAGASSFEKPDFSAVGSFSGFAGSRIGASGVFNQQLSALQDIAKNTKKTEERLAEGGAYS
jgi:hypothetical protein